MAPLRAPTLHLLLAAAAAAAASSTAAAATAATAAVPPLQPYIVSFSLPRSLSAAGPASAHSRRLSEVAYSVRVALLDASAPQSSLGRALAADGSDAPADTVVAEAVSPLFASVRGFSASLSSGAVRFLQALNSNASNAAVVRVTPDVLVRAASLARAPTVLTVAASIEVAPSWGLSRICQRSLPLRGLYESCLSGSGVDVYMVDSGINAAHVQFALQGGDLASRGANFVLTDLPARATGAGSDTSDCAGHGTHISGTVGGATVGVAPGAAIIPVRIYGCNAEGPVSAVLAGFDFALGRAASRPGVPAVINLSFATARLAVLDEAVAALEQAGLFVVAAAGNTHSDACATSPAADPNVLTAASLDDTLDTLSSFSDFGPCVFVVAPGRNIVSAYYGDGSSLATMSGTSMSAPHVAGALALLLEAQAAAAPAGPAMTLAAARAALSCAASPLAISDPVAAAAGTPPLLLFSSPAGFSAQCVGAAVAAVSTGTAPPPSASSGAAASATSSPSASPSVGAPPSASASASVSPAPSASAPQGASSGASRSPLAMLAVIFVAFATAWLH